MSLLTALTVAALASAAPQDREVPPIEAPAGPAAARAARVPTAVPTDLVLYRSGDGVRFERGDVLVESASSPSLVLVGERLIAVFERADGLARATSEDDGATWSEPLPLEVRGLPRGHDPACRPGAREPRRRPAAPVLRLPRRRAVRRPGLLPRPVAGHLVGDLDGRHRLRLRARQTLRRRGVARVRRHRRAARRAVALPRPRRRPQRRRLPRGVVGRARLPPPARPRAGARAHVDRLGPRGGRPAALLRQRPGGLVGPLRGRAALAGRDRLPVARRPGPGRGPAGRVQLPDGRRGVERLGRPPRRSRGPRPRSDGGNHHDRPTTASSTCCRTAGSTSFDAASLRFLRRVRLPAGGR